MPADVHSRIFIAAFVAVFEYGMDSATPLCKNRVAGLRPALELIEGGVQRYP